MNAVAAEALTDPRTRAETGPALDAELARWDPGPEGPADGDLDALRRGRTIEWATQTVTQGEILDAFAVHCRDELDDVDVLDSRPSRLALVWRHERSSIELRLGYAFCDRLAEDGPVLLLGPIGSRRSRSGPASHSSISRGSRRSPPFAPASSSTSSGSYATRTA